MMSDTWKGEDIAAAQRLVVDGELAALKQSRALWMLFRALDVFAVDLVEAEYAKIIDIGCGCGHYGWALENLYFPRVHYWGVDFSEAMIDQARDLHPAGRFYCCDFYAIQDLWRYEIVMVSQCIEYLEEPLEGLSWLLAQADRVILHKIRLTSGPSKKVTEPTYCGETADVLLWNMDEILRLASQLHSVQIFPWPSRKIVTLALRRRD